MLDYKYFDLFTKDTVDKQVKIEYDGGTITNAELFSESMELTESLCSESELRFGCCEASILKFKVANIMIPLAGKWLTVSETLAGNTNAPLQIGRYKVFSDKPTADRRYRDIMAYDAMYDILNADVADWYNKVLPNKNSAMPLNEFRTKFIQHFGLEQEEADLINDDMPVSKTIEPSEISGKDVITAICEINGCFGHIGRNGKFKWIYLPQTIQGLYPANDLYPDHAPDYLPYQQETGHLYPQDPKSTRIGKGTYISCKYEDFLVKTINKVQIRQEENDIGAISGDGNNCYIIEDNFLVYGMGADALAKIADKVRMKISGIIYRPFEVDCKGNPCFEVGDAVRLPTRYEIVESYILKRTLKGIQALRDDYVADGAEFYSGKVNGIQKSIIQLKGKANILERTVEETKSTIIDVEAGLKSQITQTAERIKMTVAKSQIEWDTGKYQIEIASYGAPDTIVDGNGEKAYPPEKYNGKYYLDQETGALYLSNGSTWNFIKNLEQKTAELSSRIEQTATDIKLEVKRAEGEETKLSSRIEMAEDRINATVSSVDAAEKKIATLEITADRISTTVSKKVGKDEVVSSINQTAEQVTIDASKINLNGAATFNNNVTIGKDGKITAKNATIEGKIESKDATITGGTIHIETSENVDNIIELKRGGTLVQMGNDGMKASSDTRTAVFQYSNVSVYNETAEGTLIAQLKDDGKGVSSYGWESYSDARLKHDVELLDIHERARFIYAQEPCRFKYNYDPDGHYRHGLIAQKAQETIGVEDWALCGENTDADGETYLTLNYLELIADLIATVQSLNERVAELEGRPNEQSI